MCFFCNFTGTNLISDFMEKRILVVDDEETLCEALRFNLEAEGYAVDVAHSAEQALDMAPESYDLILLDIMMDGISGTQMARRLKADPLTAHTPIIFCTARDSDDDMVRGLELGADDYITKPYSLRNVLARVRSVLRRTSPPADKISSAGLEILLDSKVCLVDGQTVSLPRKEFEILRLLLSHPGRIFSRQEILSAVWPDEVVVVDRVVDVNITRIRSKIGPYGRNIVTRSGYGYGFVA